MPGSRYGSGEPVRARRSVTSPLWSAAAAVTTLNVEPGGYVCRIARSSIGWSGSVVSRFHAARASAPVPASRPGS